MKKKILLQLLLLLLLLCIILGCSKEEYIFPGEDNINAYVYNVLETTNMSDYELVPSIEDLFINAFKAKFRGIELDFLKEAMSVEGVLIDVECVDYIAIGKLSGICQGDASLYIDEQLICTYITSEKNGSSYMQLSSDLAGRIADLVVSATWSPDSIKGKRLRISFYMNEEDWENAVIEKDPFKYLAIDVKITDN